MKIHVIVLSLMALSLSGCNKGTTRIPAETQTTNAASVTSINGMKNGVPYINYLGEKNQGC